jgi:hypothetical protein
MGERVWTFLPLHLTYLTVFVLAPLVSPWFLVPLFTLKWLADRLVRMPLGVTLWTRRSLTGLAAPCGRGDPWRAGS